MFKLIGRLLVVPLFGWAGSAGAAMLQPVTVNGVEWHDPFEFLFNSWNDINAVCDASTGACSGTLTNLADEIIDLTGWTWAGVSDINALFNHYIAPSVIGPGPGSAQKQNPPIGNPENGFSWVGLMEDDGFHSADFSDEYGLNQIYAITGALRDTGAQGEHFAGVLSYHRDFVHYYGISYAYSNYVIGSDDNGFGGWFFRDPNATAVPIANTLALVGFGLCALHFARRKGTEYI